MSRRRTFTVVAVGVAVTLAGTLLASWDTAGDVQERLDERADRVAAIVGLELERYRSASRAAAALRADEPTLDEWVVRVERLGIAEDLASVYSVASTTLGEEGGESTLVIDLVAPVDPNEAALGLDVLQVASAAPAARRALEEERVSLSEALTLVQEPGDQTGLVIYAPWYADDGSVGGVTDLVLRGQDLLDALTSEVGDVAVRLVDVETADGPREIGRLVPPDGTADDLVAVRRIEPLGQVWDVEVAAASGFVSTTERFGTLLTFLGLASITSLVALLVHVLQRREEHARAEVEERTAELVAANEELGRALRAKDEFLAVITHEFRTPITVIRGFAETAARGRAGEVPEDTRRFLERIDRHARRLHALMDNVLTTARLQTGELTFEPEAVDCNVLVAAVAAQHQHISQLSLDVDDDLLAEVDPAHLVRVLDALLSNADKYGRAPVTVTGRRAADEVVLAVEDDGDGVPAAAASRIFTAFEQADHGDMRRSQGVGLGLAVVRQLCERMGGTVVLVDKPGGARFEVRLPAADVLAGDPASVASTRTASDEG